MIILSRKLGVSRQHHVSLEEYKSKAELESIKYYQTIYLTTSGKKRPALSTQAVVEQQTATDFEYLPIQPSTLVDAEASKYKKFEPVYGNYTKQINQRLPAIQQFEGNEKLRRVGTLGMKLGMTTLYNSWGDTTPVTVVLLDRVQVVQVKPPGNGNPFHQVQLGIGEKKIKQLTKAEIGHFMKSKVPPKQ